VGEGFGFCLFFVCWFLVFGVVLGFVFGRLLALSMLSKVTFNVVKRDLERRSSIAERQVSVCMCSFCLCETVGRRRSEIGWPFSCAGHGCQLALSAIIILSVNF